MRDYLNKRGFAKTAQTLTVEANIMDDKGPPINSLQGLLYECVSLQWSQFDSYYDDTHLRSLVLFRLIDFHVRLLPMVVPLEQIPTSVT